MLGVVREPGQRHLVRVERALDLHAVDDLGPRPALRRAQDDHRPARAAVVLAAAGALLDGGDLVEAVVQRRGHRLVHLGGVVALDVARLVPVAPQEAGEVLLGDAGEDRGVGDLVAVELQDRQHRAVRRRVQERGRVPAGRERAGLRLAVADDRADDEAGVVEGGAVGVHERVAELAALVDRAGRLGRDVARDPAGEGELAEQAAHPLGVGRDVGVDLAVGALEVGVRDEPRAAVAGAGDVDRVEVARPDRAVHVRVDQVEPGRRAPVARGAAA